MFEPLTESILGRAQKEGLIDLHLHDLRQWGTGTHRQVDDSPYGGGAGMLLRADIVVPAIEAIMKEGTKGTEGTDVSSGTSTPSVPSVPSVSYRIYLSPRGKRLDQPHVETLAKHEWLLLLCGHYEGIDHRIIEGGWIDAELSIGDYVLTGGELPAMVVIDAVARQIPGVLGHDESAAEESFSSALDRKREYPHYTKPAEFRGLKVPDILIGGNHGAIAEWRKENLS